MKYKIYYVIIFINFYCDNVYSEKLNNYILKSKVKPPTPKYGFNNGKKLNKKVSEDIQQWQPTDENYIWELSGLYEGDIMLYESDSSTNNIRSGKLRKKSRWPNSTVPFYIDLNDFEDHESEKILEAIDDFHSNTCVKFRPYERGDENFIVIRGSSTGCWSRIGMKKGGQTVHLQSNSGCLRHGVIIHELLHALGFLHQHSVAERDDYVTINWDNIREGREHNFRKANSPSSFNFEYDYGSVMHYSKKAFSRNGEPTIEPLVEGVKLGQRRGFSSKDIKKVNILYEPIYCHLNDAENEELNAEDALLSWIDSLFDLT